MPNADLNVLLADAALVATADEDLSGLFQILDDATLDAVVYVESSGLSLVQTLDDTVILAIAYKEIQAELIRPLQRAVLTAQVQLGTAPPPPLIGRLHNLTGEIRDNGGAILCFTGWPNRSVEWRVLEGLGTITPFTTYTDELGRASARFDPAGFIGRVLVGVAYVP